MAAWTPRPTVIPLEGITNENTYLVFDLEDPAGTAFDLTGVTVAARVTKEAGAAAVMTGACSTSGNRVTVDFDATGIVPGQYIYAVKLTHATWKKTAVIGTFSLTPGVL